MRPMIGLAEKAKAQLERLRNKNMQVWVGGYARWLASVASSRVQAGLRPSPGPRHLLFAFCDHFEPLFKTTDHAVGHERVRAWHEQYPKLAAGYRDADGRPPRHSFFFPGEEYVPGFIDRLTDLVGRGFGEVELHMHHDGDTADSVRKLIADYLGKLASHGHLSRDGGRPRYAFIHGNWALANARRDGKWCGVDDEVPLLFETGCYADFTFPAVPDESQPPIVNQIYWPEGDLSRRRAQDQGTRARVGEIRRDRILMIEGPLAFAVRPGRVPMPRVEYGAITAVDLPTPSRVRSWVRQGIHVEGRPEWIFVKVYTHGAPEAQAAALLNEGGHMLHRELTTRYNDGDSWRLHYVTAREMYNIAIAAMDGRDGDPGRYRDYVLPPPPAAARA
jgi:hypothetical protein